MLFLLLKGEKQMIHELTKEQMEMVEYSDSHSYNDTCERFSTTKNQIGYFRRKRKRIEEQNKISDSTFVEVPISNIIEQEESKDEEISFSINNAKIRMNLSDFKKVFLND